MLLHLLRRFTNNMASICDHRLEHRLGILHGEEKVVEDL